MVMKMSENDRLMAIARCPAYIEEFKKFLFLWDKGNETSPEKVEAFDKNLCRKWKLKSLIPPKLGKDEESFLKANRREAIVDLAENEWPQNALMVMYQAYTGECQYVRLKIDITKTEKELLKAFRERISLWKKHIRKQWRTRKTRKTIYDPWEIYDDYQSGMSLPDIARKISGQTGSVAYNEELDKVYQRVKRAYDQAERMILAAQNPV